MGGGGGGGGGGGVVGGGGGRGGGMGKGGVDVSYYQVQTYPTSSSESLRAVGLFFPLICLLKFTLLVVSLVNQSFRER